jgi:importin-9
MLASSRDFGADFKFSYAGYMSEAESATIPRIIRDLGPFLLETSEDTLSLVLETVSVLSGVANGSWFTRDLAEALTAALLDVWPKNIKGMFLLSSSHVC